MIVCVKERKEDETMLNARTLTSIEMSCAGSLFNWMPQIAKAHWYLSRSHEAMCTQAHGSPQDAHRRIGFKATCSHKSREDKTKTLIVAISPLV